MTQPSTPTEKPRILVVDDEPGILTTMKEILSDEGYEVITTPSGSNVEKLYSEKRPGVVFLDIWLPDMDGLEILQKLRESDPTAAIIMISGHGTIATAVKAMKMGAYDYIEKPLSLMQILESVKGALTYRETLAKDTVFLKALDLNRTHMDTNHDIVPPPPLSILKRGKTHQRTIKKSRVIYGLGLHSGTRTGMIVQPLPPNSGIHFLTLPAGNMIPAHFRAVATTSYATSLSIEGETIHTVEHFLSALHAYGISNLLIKIHGEIPVLDGSALQFCQLIEETGIVEQDDPLPILSVDKVYEVSKEGEKILRIEPAETLSISYFLRYPPPIGEQEYTFTFTDVDAYRETIAPARTFGFMKDLKMLAELGLGSGGRLDNCILVGEDNVVNTQLRFPDEFVRHKILDIMGDLYLLGYPVRGKVEARLTGHRDNIALLKAIVEDQGAPN